MHVIALAQQKGGVGKSTLAINLAAEAQRLGKRAVVLELDRQGTASFWSSRRRDEGGRKLPPEVMKIDANQVEQTLGVLRGLDVQVVTLDLPGAHNSGINAAIKMSDLVLLPVRPQETDISASAEPLAVVHRLRKPYAFVLTFVEAKGGRAEEANRELAAEGHPVCPQFMWRRQEYVDAIVNGEAVMEFGKRNKAADEIAAIWKWIIKSLETTHETKGRRNARNH